MKITRSTTKEQLIRFIGANVKEVREQDKNLFDQIAYADKTMNTEPKKVTKADLITLAKDIMKLLGDKCHDINGEPVTATPVAENSVKPKLSAKGKKTQPKPEPEQKKEPAKEKPKKPANKPVNDYATADSFPAELNVGGVAYELLHEEIKSFEDLATLLKKDVEVVLAFYWTPKQIKCEGSTRLPMPPKFENNLDLATLLYVSDEGKVAYALSMYTETMYMVLPESLEEIEGMRFCLGIEYQIYKRVETNL